MEKTKRKQRKQSQNAFALSYIKDSQGQQKLPMRSNLQGRPELLSILFFKSLWTRLLDTLNNNN